MKREGRVRRKTGKTGKQVGLDSDLREEKKEKAT